MCGWKCRFQSFWNDSSNDTHDEHGTTQLVSPGHGEVRLAQPSAAQHHSKIFYVPMPEHDTRNEALKAAVVASHALAC